jgi:hypothetical protein
LKKQVRSQTIINGSETPPDPSHYFLGGGDNTSIVQMMMNTKNAIPTRI